MAGRTPYVFTPPHEGGSRLDGVVCIGADPTQQLEPRSRWLTEHHGLRRWALVGNDYIWPRSVHASARRLVTSHGSEVVARTSWWRFGDVTARVDRLVDDLRRTRADAVLLSLVGRDLVTFHRALRHSDLDRRLVRLSGALEENGLLAGDGERAGTFYAAMSSFASMTDERHTETRGAARHGARPRAPRCWTAMPRASTTACTSSPASRGEGPCGRPGWPGRRRVRWTCTGRAACTWRGPRASTSPWWTACA